MAPGGRLRGAPPSSSSAPTSGGITTTSAFRCMRRARLTGLWSLWYCGLVLSLHMYLTAGSIQQFVSYISLPWPDEARPFPELNAFVAMVGAGVALMPFFAVSAALRVGNLANDGCKLGGAAAAAAAVSSGSSQTSQRSTRSAGARQTALMVVRTMWRHGGPTAPFLHVVSAFCLLFPKVLVQAKLIKYGFLPKEDIWRTDLDFMIAHKDRLVVLGFLASAVTNRTSVAESLVAASTSPATAGGAGDRPHSSMSPEFINYAVALLVYSIRYPAVFWETNKPFSFLFSMQLVLSSAQSLLASAAFAVLYKVNTYGLAALVPLGGTFLLSRPASVLLFLTSAATVTLSGGIVYLYGFRRFQASMVRQRAKHHISWREGSRTLWGYLPHCLAFATLLAVLLLSGPLMYDLTVVYRGSLDGTVLSGVVGTFLYLFLWIVLWFSLTLKQRWRFRLCPPGASSVRGDPASGVQQQQRHRHSRGAPLIVVSGGHTFTVKDAAPKRAILGVVQKSVLHQQRCRSGFPNNEEDDSGDDIYWLKPKLPVIGRSSRDEMEEEQGAAWSSKKKKTSPGVKHKVTFEDDALVFGGGGGGGGGGLRSGRTVGLGGKSPKACLAGRLKKPCVTFEDLTDSEEDDDGDYATLRDIPLPEVDDEDEGDEDEEEALENLLTQTVDPSDDEDRDFHGRPCGSGSECSADPELLRLLGPVHRINVAVTVHDESPSPPVRIGLDLLTVRTSDQEEELEHQQHHHHHHHHQHHPMGGATTPRSNSVSSTSSPPEKGGGGGGGGSSDTSSGIHSSSSICCESRTGAAKSSSMDDLTAGSVTDTSPYSAPPGQGGGWKSMSLQRTPATQTPTGDCGSPNSSSLQRGGAGRDAYGLRQQYGTAESPTGTGGHHRCGNHFGRATNVRLTSFTDCPTTPTRGQMDTTSLSTQPTAGRAAVKMSPLTIGVLSGSPKQYHPQPNSYQQHSSSATKAPNTAKGVLDRKRDSANYSLTSSGESDGCLFHT